jgi:hypothetical protein
MFERTSRLAEQLAASVSRCGLLGSLGADMVPVRLFRHE